MTKKELVKETAGKLGFTQKDVRAVLDALQEVAFDNLKSEGGVKIFDGVTLGARYKEAHIGRNPKTGEEINVEAKYHPVAKFGTGIKDALNA